MPNTVLMDKPISIREEVLLGAKEHILYERNEAYGTPDENFTLIAAMWDNYLSKLDHRINSADVANMMILLKVARGHNNHNSRLRGLRGRMRGL